MTAECCQSLDQMQAPAIVPSVLSSLSVSALFGWVKQSNFYSNLEQFEAGKLKKK